MKSILSVIFTFIFFGNCLAADSALSCDVIFGQEAAALSTITLDQFDRTPGRGWRVLNDAKCYSQAEELLNQYLLNHEPQSSLYLHLGQIQLREEKRTAAASNFRKALREGGSGEFKFNDFSLALAAYAEQDRIAFEKHTAIVAAHTANFGNRQNMNLLNALADNFTKKYTEILAILAKENPTN
jgi:hypothetical protein